MNIKIDHVTDNGVLFPRMVLERTPRHFSDPFTGWRTEEQITKPPAIPEDTCDITKHQNLQSIPDQDVDHALPDQPDDRALPDQPDDQALPDQLIQDVQINANKQECWDSIFSDTTSSSQHIPENLERNKKPQIDLANYFAGINRKGEQKRESNCFVLKGFTTWSH